MPPPKKFLPRKGPEAIIQEDIIKFLRYRGWYVKDTHGNMYQSGFPDLFISHPRYGMRWVEVKNPLKYAFTPAQLENFPLMCAHGAGIWIMTAAEESEYSKLFGPFNWYFYLQALRG